MPTLLAAALAYAVCVALLLYAEARGLRRLRVAAKLLASSCFVLAALAAGATSHGYGRWVVLALGLSWLGDALLLARSATVFLAGIGAFLLAHVAFAVGFMQWPLAPRVLPGAALVLALAGAGLLRWLWPHLAPLYRRAVPLYVLAIGAMCTLAIAASAATGQWALAVGALAFAVSDVSVARDRFVRAGFANRAWGLPLYYAAQLLLAATVSLGH